MPISDRNEGARPRIDHADRLRHFPEAGKKRIVGLPCPPSAPSILAFGDEARGGAQHVALGAEDRERGIGARQQVAHALLGAVDPELGDEGGLAQRRVLPGLLAERRGVALDVEQIVGDLEGFAERAAVIVERLIFLRRGLAEDRAGDAADSATARRSSSAAAARRRPARGRRTGPRRRDRASGRRPCRRFPMRAPARGSAAAARSASLWISSRVMMSKASVNSPSPARIAVASSVFLCSVGRPRRRSLLSIAGRSSWISE